jgi:hypothetical protein
MNRFVNICANNGQGATHLGLVAMTASSPMVVSELFKNIRADLFLHVCVQDPPLMECTSTAFLTSRHEWQVGRTPPGRTYVALIRVDSSKISAVGMPCLSLPLCVGLQTTRRHSITCARLMRMNILYTHYRCEYQTCGRTECPRSGRYDCSYFADCFNKLLF